jgi:ribosomal protein S18 acetylase RimI-like enzyme
LNIDNLKLTKLTLGQVKTLVSYAQKEGWNPGPYDAEAFFNTDPDGFYGYILDNELIAGGSVVSYDGAFGFMGFFIVIPKYRGIGIGRKLWYERRNLLHSRLHSNAAIGMDGVLAMQSFYQKGGFEIAFRDERYEKMGSSFDVHPLISEIKEEDFQQILSYDTQCFGVDRSHFLKLWLQLPESHAFKYSENGMVKGYCMIRKAALGYKVCPLFANDFDIAQELYKACLNKATGSPVYIDIPVTNEKAVQLIKTFKATYVFECARMYYGTPPKMALDKVFGITTFELG